MEEQRLTVWFNQRITPRSPRLLNRKNIEIPDDLEIFSPCTKDLSMADHWSSPSTEKLGKKLFLELIDSILIDNYHSIWLNEFYKVQFPGKKKELRETILDETFGRHHHQWSEARRALISRLCHAIYFFDKAKRCPTGPAEPCLFTKPNSSQTILDQLCRETLSTGQVSRFQARVRNAVGSMLQHRESPVHHLDMNVYHLSTDLCDGIRLARIAQAIIPTSFGNLLDQVKYPAERARQRTENVRLVFKLVGPTLQRYDPDGSFQWNEKNAEAVAQSCRQETIQLLTALMQIDGVVRLENDFKQHLDRIVWIQQTVRRRRLALETRKRFLDLRRAAIVLQCRFRALSIARSCRAEYLRVRGATITIQRWYRRRRNWTIARKHVTEFLDRRYRAAVRIQSAWRGYITRVKEYVHDSRLYMVASRLHQPGRAPGRKIGLCATRIVKRIVQLNNRPVKVTEQLASDLEHLNRYCCWSKEIRFQLTQRKELIPAMGHIMSALNRSEHHRKCAMCIITILEMAWKPPPTVATLPGLVVQTIGNYLNYAPLVLVALRLLAEMVANQPNISRQLAIDIKWSKLTTRIRSRYRTDGPECQICLSIQAQLNKIS